MACTFYLFAIQSSLLILILLIMIIVLVILLVEEEAPLVSFQSLEIRHSVGNQDQHQPRLTLRLDHLNQKY